jgi:DNA-binding transcriptional regulator of glucitol operon
LAAWAYFSWRQQKNYQEALKQLYDNKSLLGVGCSKSCFHPGRNTILILALNQDKQKICGCRKLSGIKVWQAFEELKIYNNYSLDELRELAILEDTLVKPKRFNWQKDCYHKGALLQAIEALHSRRLKQKIDAINQRRLETIEASLAVGTFPGHTIIEDKIEDRIEDEIEDNIKNSIEDDKEDALKEENDEYLS